MENQHRKISGYRELSAEEIELMNAVKAFERQTMELARRIEQHLEGQVTRANAARNYEEIARIQNAEPRRWISIGRTHLQEGFMAYVRAIAQPVSP